jgi:hypothetical protein
VISLKDTFYHKADSLIGIFKDQDKESSGSLTLDLRNFDNNSSSKTLSHSAVFGSAADSIDESKVSGDRTPASSSKRSGRKRTRGLE